MYPSRRWQELDLFMIITAGLLISFGVVLLTPTPEPRRMTVAQAAAALSNPAEAARQSMSVRLAGAPPKGRDSALITSALARQLGRPPGSVRAYWIDDPAVRAARAGAVPDAIHLEWTHNLTPEGTFKSSGDLRAMYERAGVTPEREVITYCQGGYRAAHAYLALRLIGYPAIRNYLGSWKEWGDRTDLPIEVPGLPESE